VVAVRGEQVRIGIEAPRELAVDRQEVHDRRMQFQDARPAKTAENSVSDASCL
jgi:sRNA-binding carbon storage regulator CsrA